MNFSTKFFLLRLCVVASCVFFVSNQGVAETYLSVGAFAAQGERVYLQDPEISIETFAGWQGHHEPQSGITLQMRGPEVRQKVPSGTLKFRPFLQLRTIHKAEPVDAQRVKSFQQELQHQFTEKTPLKDFQILKVERMSFNKPEDALAVFSSYVSQELELLQLHVLRAAEDRQYVITYTDLYKPYMQDSEKQNQVWQVISSLDYPGEAADRHAWLWQLLAVLSITLLLPMALLAWSRFRQMRRLKKIVRSTISSSPPSRRSKAGQQARRRKSSRKNPVVLHVDL